MKESASTNKFSWKKVFAGAVAVLGLMGTVVGIATGVIPWFQDRHNVDGTWTLKTVTQKTTDTKFKNMELTYTINLTHDGTHVSGRGTKLGEKLADETYTEYEGKARTPIEIDGNLDGDGDLLHAVVTEEGVKRASAGSLELNWNGKSWVGTFQSDAATSSGTALLSRSVQ